VKHNYKNNQAIVQTFIIAANAAENQYSVGEAIR